MTGKSYIRMRYGEELNVSLSPGMPRQGSSELTLGPWQSFARDRFGEAITTSKISEERFNLTPEAPVKNVVKGLQILDYALAVESVVRATQVGEGGSVLVQELTRAAVSGGSVVAANAGVRAVALALGVADGPEPGPVDIALQAGASVLISGWLTDQVMDMMFDLDNPDRFGRLQRDDYGNWYREEARPGFYHTGPNATLQYDVPIFRVYVKDPEVKELLEAQRAFKLNAERGWEDDYGNRHIAYEAGEEVVFSPRGSATIYTENGVFRVEDGARFAVVETEYGLRQVPLAEDGKDVALDWSGARIVDEESLLQGYGPIGYDMLMPDGSRIIVDRNGDTQVVSADGRDLQYAYKDGRYLRMTPDSLVLRNPNGETIVRRLDDDGQWYTEDHALGGAVPGGSILDPEGDGVGDWMGDAAGFDQADFDAIDAADGIDGLEWGKDKGQRIAGGVDDMLADGARLLQDRDHLLAEMAVNRLIPPASTMLASAASDDAALKEVVARMQARTELTSRLADSMDWLDGPVQMRGGADGKLVLQDSRGYRVVVDSDGDIARYDARGISEGALEVNQYAHAMTTALNFYTAVEGGNTMAMATSGAALLEQINGLTGIGDVPGIDLPGGAGIGIGQGLNMISAAMNFRDALDSGDALGILATGSSLGASATGVYASYAAASEMAAAQTAAAASSTLGMAAGVLGIAYSLSEGNAEGAMISAVAMIPGYGWMIAAALTVISMLNEYEPFEAPSGSGHFTRGEDGSVLIDATGTEGNQADHVEQSMAGRFGDLQDELAGAPDGGKIVRVAMEHALGRLQEHLGENLALVAERMPSVQYNGYFFIIEYADATTGETRQVAAAPADIVDGLVSAAMQAEAVVPAWEAETIDARRKAGVEDYWKTDAQWAGQAPDSAMTPVVLDLDGNGQVRTTDEPVVLFDSDADGYLERSAWMWPEDGFVVVDKNLDGRIAGRDELVGTAGGRGVEALQWYDANGDGLINSSDPVFSALKLWVDVNADAVADFSEVIGLYRLGIVEVDYVEGTYTTASGQKWKLDEALLQTESAGVRMQRLQGGMLVDEEEGETAFWVDRGGPVRETAGGGNIKSAPTVVRLTREGRQVEEGTRIQEQGEEGRGPFAGNAGALLAMSLGVGAMDAMAASGAGAAGEAETSRTRNNSAQNESARNVEWNRSGTGVEILYPGHERSSGTGEKAAENREGDTATARKEGSGQNEQQGMGRSVGEAHVGQQLNTVANWTKFDGTIGPVTDNAEVNDAIRTESGSTGTRGAGLRSDASSNTGPVLNEDVLQTSEDALTEIEPALLLANDFDEDGDWLRVVDVGAAEHGEVRLDKDGMIRFVPEENYHGPASFEYFVVDQQGHVARSVAHLNIISVNDNPTAILDPLAAIEDITTIIPVGQLAYDVDGDELAVVEVGNAVNGQVSLDEEGNVRFRATPDFYGEASFDYVVEDGNGGRVAATARLQIQPVNDAPRIVSLTHDPVIYGYRPIFESDGEGGQFITGYEQVHDPVLAVMQDEDSFGEYVLDSEGNRHPATRDTGGNLVPISAREAGDRYTGHLEAVDVDGPDDAITWRVISQPLHGVASIDQNGNWSLSRGECDGYSGNVSFQVGAFDAEGAVSTQTITAMHHGFGCGDSKKPVVLDMDNDGLELTDIDDSNVYFDVNDDGWREHIAWVAEDDALLVLDQGMDGKIESYDEISFIGYQDGAQTDLEGLAAFDLNGDGVLSKEDPVWGMLGIWQDRNQNGTVEDGELRYMNETGIASIGLKTDGQERMVEGNTVFGEALYTRIDGSVGIVGDVALTVDAKNRIAAEGEDALEREEAELNQAAEQIRQEIAARTMADEDVAHSVVTDTTEPALMLGNETQSHDDLFSMPGTQAG